ncbi:MAG TPA: M15 family metallopeptidase [Thermoanaerobaculia bacterium]|jgi:hypothetical protein|nr:M15 family metallopeptidase [Thermoanaerobaculia bacterium]
MALDDRIAIPPKSTMNIGLSPASEMIMLATFGQPGALTRDCSDPTGKFRKRITFGADVGPFKVSGLDFAVQSLRQVFAEVKEELPDVFASVKTEGLLCVRHRRKNPKRFSNHSWGTAIDLFFGSEVVDQGENETHRGNLLLFPFFNRHGWFWGAAFSGTTVDSMHFELSEEAISKLPQL